MSVTSKKLVFTKEQETILEDARVAIAVAFEDGEYVPVVVISNPESDFYLLINRLVPDWDSDMYMRRAKLEAQKSVECSMETAFDFLQELFAIQDTVYKITAFQDLRTENTNEGDEIHASIPIEKITDIQETENYK